MPILFAGPSLVDLDCDLVTGLELRPPARRGDIDALLDIERDPGVIILADGIFHQYPSIGHAEIRRAIRIGWQVWGVSSMGAIRAAEMIHHGMLGFGYVYQQYVNDPDFTDDEVALLHLSRKPYTPVTEPLIHIRLFVAGLRDLGLLTEAQESRVIMNLKALWYGKRDLSLLGEVLQRETDLSEIEITEQLRTVPSYRRKNQDLGQFLREQPWRLARTH